MTDELSPTIDVDAHTIRRSITIDAPVEKVWASLTEPDRLRDWFASELDLVRVEPGAEGTVTFGSGNTFPLRVEDVEPMRTVAFRWSSDEGHPVDVVDVEHSTVFRFILEPWGPGTELTVIESGFETMKNPVEGLRNNDFGWTGGLERILTYFAAN